MADPRPDSPTEGPEEPSQSEPLLPLQPAPTPAPALQPPVQPVANPALNALTLTNLLRSATPPVPPVPQLPGAGAPGLPATQPAANADVAALDTEFRSLFRRVQNALPFVVLLLLVFIHQHLFGICVFGVSSAVLLQLDHKFRKQVALKENMENKAVALIMCASMIQSSVSMFTETMTTTGVQTHSSVLTGTPSFWDILWVVSLYGTQTWPSFLQNHNCCTRHRFFNSIYVSGNKGSCCLVAKQVVFDGYDPRQHD